MDGDKLRELNIKNCVYYYLGSFTNKNDLDFENIFLDKKSYEHIFLYYL